MCLREPGEDSFSRLMSRTSGLPAANLLDDSFWVSGDQGIKVVKAPPVGMNTFLMGLPLQLLARHFRFLP